MVKSVYFNIEDINIRRYQQAIVRIVFTLLANAQFPMSYFLI